MLKTNQKQTNTNLPVCISQSNHKNLTRTGSDGGYSCILSPHFHTFFPLHLTFFFFFIWYEFNKRRPISIPPSLITSGTVGALWASPPPLNVPLLDFQVSSDLVWECQLSSWNPSEKLRDGETCRERSCGGGAEKDETWQVNKEIFALHCS